MPRRNVTYLLALLLSFVLAVVGLALFEFALRRFHPMIPKIPAGRFLGEYDDEVGRLLKANTQARHRGPEFDVHYSTNSQGLRDAVLHAPKKAPGTTRILVLGDSFVFGVGNSYEELFTVLMERKLNEAGYKVELIKVGMGGYDTRTEYIYLKRFWSRFTPDRALIAFLPNDLFTNLPLDAPKSAVERGIQTVHSPRVRELHMIEFAKWLLYRSDAIYVKAYLTTVRGQYFAKDRNEHVRQQFRVTKDLMREIHRYVSTQGGSLDVVSIPQFVQVLAVASGRSLPDHAFHSFDHELGQLAKAESFTWIPTLDALAQAQKSGQGDTHFRLDGHLTPLGNRVIGQHLVQEYSKLLAPDGSNPTNSPSR